MKQRMTAYLNLSLAMVIVGSSVVFGKVITFSFPVFLASGLRFAIASIILLPILYINDAQMFKLSRKDCINLLFMAVCGQVVFTFFVLLGLRYTSSIEAGLITSSSPAVMAGVTWLFFRERLQMLQVIAIVAVIAGIVIVNGVFSLDMAAVGAGHAIGNLLMVGAVIGEAFFLLMRKRISEKISDLALTGYLCFFGFFLFLPLSIWQGLDFDFLSVDTTAWLSMLYFGAVFTVFAYLFWFKGVSKVTGSVAAIFTAVMPVSAVALSIVFLGESFTLNHGIGGGLILVSIFLMTVPEYFRQYRNNPGQEDGDSCRQELKPGQARLADRS